MLSSLSAAGVSLLLLGVGFVAPADAHQPWLFDKRGKRLDGPYQRWVHRSLMPKMRGRLTVRFGGCPNRRFAACVRRSRPRVMYLPRRARRLLFYHELGHLFDYHVLAPGDRLAFTRLIRAGGRPWRGGRNSPAERFAEAYALCSRYRRLRRPRARVASHYRYVPSAASHRSACRLIRRAARRPKRHAPPARRPPAREPHRPPPRREPPPRRGLFQWLLDPGPQRLSARRSSP